MRGHLAVLLLAASAAVVSALPICDECDKELTNLAKQESLVQVAKQQSLVQVASTSLSLPACSCTKVVDGIDIITGGFYCEKHRSDVCMPVAGGCDGEMSLCTMTATATKAIDAPSTTDTPAQGPSYALDGCGCTQYVNFNGISTATPQSLCQRPSGREMVCMPNPGQCPTELKECSNQLHLSLTAINSPPEAPPPSPPPRYATCDCWHYVNFNGGQLRHMDTLCQKWWTGMCMPSYFGCPVDFFTCSIPHPDPPPFPPSRTPTSPVRPAAVVAAAALIPAISAVRPTQRG